MTSSPGSYRQTCLTCGRPLPQGHPASQLYCSAYCLSGKPTNIDELRIPRPRVSATRQSVNGRPRHKRSTYRQTCLTCGQRLPEGHPASQLYCSANCLPATIDELPTPAPRVSATRQSVNGRPKCGRGLCPVCGRPRQRGVTMRGRYCCAICASWDANPETILYRPRMCMTCGTTFAPASSTHRYCSEECRPSHRARVANRPETELGRSRAARLLALKTASVREDVVDPLKADIVSCWGCRDFFARSEPRQAFCRNCVDEGNPLRRFPVLRSEDYTRLLEAQGGGCADLRRCRESDRRSRPPDAVGSRAHMRIMQCPPRSTCRLHCPASSSRLHEARRVSGVVSSTGTQHEAHLPRKTGIAHRGPRSSHSSANTCPRALQITAS